MVFFRTNKNELLLRILLAISEGPAAGQKIVVSPGQTIRIGRERAADYVIADAFLSSLHFTVRNSGARCTVVDLNSRNGLFVNNRRVREADLHAFDTITAGSTRFVANFIEDAQAPAAAPGSTASLPIATDLPAMTLEFSVPAQLNEAQRKVFGLLNQGRGTLYGILDSAQDSAIMDLLRGSDAEYQILYDGKSAEDLANDGPYLVRFPKPNQLLAECIRGGWGKNWGVFLRTDLALTDLRSHLRHFLMVQMPDEKIAYLRFYDPRVMREFVTGFNGEEARQFFGPIRYYMCEAEAPTHVMVLGAGPQGVIAKEQPLEGS